MKVWVLTGDKMETAINIGTDCLYKSAQKLSNSLKQKFVPYSQSCMYMYMYLSPSLSAGYASRQLVSGMDIMTISDLATVEVREGDPVIKGVMI